MTFYFLSCAIIKDQDLLIKSDNDTNSTPEFSKNSISIFFNTSLFMLMSVVSIYNTRKSKHNGIHTTKDSKDNTSTKDQISILSQTIDEEVIQKRRFSNQIHQKPIIESDNKQTTMPLKKSVDKDSNKVASNTDNEITKTIKSNVNKDGINHVEITKEKDKSNDILRQELKSSIEIHNKEFEKKPTVVVEEDSNKVAPNTDNEIQKTIETNVNKDAKSKQLLSQVADQFNKNLENNEFGQDCSKLTLNSKKNQQDLSSKDRKTKRGDLGNPDLSRGIRV